MHPQCMEYFRDTLQEITVRDLMSLSPRVLEIGSLNINGSLRDLFLDQSNYWGIDVQDGPGVDEVADARTWSGFTSGGYDLVLCAEVLEHQYDWRGIINQSAFHTADDGYFIMTAAGVGRHPHSAKTGWHLEHGQYDEQPHDITDELEYYKNITEYDLSDCLEDVGFRHWNITTPGEDIQCWATRRGARL